MRTLLAGAIVAAALIAGSSAQAAPVAAPAGSVLAQVIDRDQALQSQGAAVQQVDWDGRGRHGRHGRHWRDRPYGYYYAPPPRYYYAPPPPVYYAPPPPPRYYYPSRPGGYFSFGFGGPL